MSIWQKKIFGKRTETILRYISMVILAFAGLIFALMLVLLCVGWFREKNFLPLAFCVVYLVLAFLTFISFYFAQNLWLESFSGSPQSVIVKLQAHDFQSLQFFNIAARYFRRRLHIIWMSSLFPFFMAAVSIPIFLLSQAPLWCCIIGFVGSSYGAYLCWLPCRIGLNGIRMIDAACKLNQPDQLFCLQFIATKYAIFRRDPVAIYILGVLKQENLPA